MFKSYKMNKAGIFGLLGCVVLLGGCYNSGSRQAFFANPPPPPVLIPHTPREAITMVAFEPSYDVASLEPSSGDLANYLGNKTTGCTSAGPAGNALAYQWQKNSVGLDVADSATLRFRMALGEEKQFKRSCEKAGWSGFVHKALDE